MHKQAFILHLAMAADKGVLNYAEIRNINIYVNVYN